MLMQKGIVTYALLATAICLFTACAQSPKKPVVIAVAPTIEVPSGKRVFKLYEAWAKRDISLYGKSPRTVYVLDVKPSFGATGEGKLYWVRIKAEGERWELESASYEPLQRRNFFEEVLLVSPLKLAYHPNWGRRLLDGTIPHQSGCTVSDARIEKYYSPCNSSFATLAAAHPIFGGFFQGNGASKPDTMRTYSFSAENLEKAIAQIDLDGAISRLDAESVKNQPRLAAIAEKRRELDELKEKQREQRAVIEMANKKQAEDAVYMRVAKYPAGFKDVCVTGGYGGYSFFQIDEPKDPSIVCQNIGEISSLARLKDAGYMVTNVSKSVRPNDQGLSGVSWSWQYNVERFNLKK